VYQKIPFVVSNSSEIPIFIPNIDVSRRSIRGNSTIPKRGTYTLSMEYWDYLSPVLSAGEASNKKAKNNAGNFSLLFLSVV
jgi:hypothetical protein